MKKVYNGVVDITNEEYHASAGISRSGILRFMECPKKYWYEYLNPFKPERKVTKAMTFGSAFHTYILEPHLFDEQYYVATTADGRTVEGRRIKAEQALKSEGKIILDREEFKTLEAMKLTLLQDPKVNYLLDGAAIEKSIYWTDPDTGILCKVRPDIWQSDFVVDLKTADTAGRHFRYDFFRRGYHLQLAMIQEGLKHTCGDLIDSFYDLAIEKEAPYCHAIFEISPDVIEQGVIEFKKILVDIEECQTLDTWPSYKKTMIGL